MQGPAVKANNGLINLTLQSYHAILERSVNQIPSLAEKFWGQDRTCI
jgi:hypothetical protein